MGRGQLKSGLRAVKKRLDFTEYRRRAVLGNEGWSSRPTGAHRESFSCAIEQAMAYVRGTSRGGYPKGWRGSWETDDRGRDGQALFCEHHIAGGERMTLRGAEIIAEQLEISPTRSCSSPIFRGSQGRLGGRGGHHHESGSEFGLEFPLTISRILKRRRRRIHIDERI
jgi:hypothetical protein